MTSKEILEELKEENKKLKEELAIHGDEGLDIIHELENENKKLKKQIDYIRSGEYYNQLRFENEMLQQVVDTNGVPSEVYDYIDCTHRNTELLEERENFIKWLTEDIEKRKTLIDSPRVQGCDWESIIEIEKDTVKLLEKILEKVVVGKYD